MRLVRLLGTGFRNLAPFDLHTDAPFVVFHGANAQGKTNALEAVYLLCTLRPLRARRRAELVQWGAERAVVTGWVHTPEIARRHRVDLTARSRSVELDGHRVSDLSEYFAGIRCVCFTPQDARIVAGEPAWRRRWLDRAAFTARPSHLDVVRAYRRALAQKAAALKAAPSGDLLDALDEAVARAGAELVARRVAMLDELAPHVQVLHRELAGGRGEVRLAYRTAATGADRGERVVALRRALREARPRELTRATTLVGPQTDEVRVEIDGRSARTYGSRGQVRSLVLALKLAELVAAHRRGEVPLFLIDDVSSELDRARTGRLVGLLAELRAQVWATTTAPEHMAGLPERDTLRIEVVRGSLTPDTPRGTHGDSTG